MCSDYVAAINAGLAYWENGNFQRIRRLTPLRAHHRISTWNSSAGLHGDPIKANEKMQFMLHLVKQCSVTCIQEARGTLSDVERLRTLVPAGYEVFASHDNLCDRYTAGGLLFVVHRRCYKQARIEHVKHIPGRLESLMITVKNTRLIVHNLHLEPRLAPAEKCEQIDIAARQMNGSSSLHVLCGDFNCQIPNTARFCATTSKYRADKSRVAYHVVSALANCTECGYEGYSRAQNGPFGHIFSMIDRVFTNLRYVNSGSSVGS